MTNRVTGSESQTHNWQENGTQGDSPAPLEAVKDNLQQQLTKCKEAVERAVISKPGVSLAVAAAAGLLLGLMVKRK